MANNDAALGQKIFNITKAQAKPKIQPDSVFNDFGWETMAFEARRIFAFGHDEHLRSIGATVNLTIPFPVVFGPSDPRERFQKQTPQVAQH